MLFLYSFYQLKKISPVFWKKGDFFNFQEITTLVHYSAIPVKMMSGMLDGVCGFVDDT